MSKNNISIKVQTRQTKTNKDLVVIYLRIFTNGAGKKGEFIVSTRLETPKKQWDNTKKLVKGNLEEARRINKSLHQYINQVHELFDTYKSQAPIINSSDFKTLVGKEIFGIDRITSDKHSHNQMYLPDLFDRYLSLHDSNLGKSRKSRYEFVKRNVVDFTIQEFDTDKFDYTQLDRDWHFRFKDYLLESFEYATDTLTGYLKVLRAVVNDAYKSKLLKENPFINCPLEYGEHDIKYLNKTELASIEAFESPNSRLQLVADCFKFASHTGLSHGDMRRITLKNLKKENNNWVLVVKRKKTDVESIIPIDETAKSVLEKYNFLQINNDSPILPVPYINEYNNRLKIIAAICNIDRNLTSHIARHTFATTVWLENKGSLEVLQKILGHKNIRTTQRYGRITANRVIDEAKGVLSLAS